MPAVCAGERNAAVYRHADHWVTAPRWPLQVDGGWHSPLHGQRNPLLAGSVVAVLLGFYLVRRVVNGRY